MKLLTIRTIIALLCCITLLLPHCALAMDNPPGGAPLAQNNQPQVEQVAPDAAPLQQNNQPANVAALQPQVVADCSICMGALNHPITLVCDHQFCNACIHRWIKGDPNDQPPITHDSCPLCRAIIDNDVRDNIEDEMLPVPERIVRVRTRKIKKIAQYSLYSIAALSFLSGTYCWIREQYAYLEHPAHRAQPRLNQPTYFEIGCIFMSLGRGSLWLANWIGAHY